MQSAQSAAAQVVATIIPIIVILFSSITVLFCLVNYHKHKVLMIENRIYKRSSFNAGMFSLFFGLFLIGLSIGFTFLLLIKGRFNITILNKLMSVLKVFAILD